MQSLLTFPTDRKCWMSLHKVQDFDNKITEVTSKRLRKGYQTTCLSDTIVNWTDILKTLKTINTSWNIIWIVLFVSWEGKKNAAFPTPTPPNKSANTRNTVTLRAPFLPVSLPVFSPVTVAPKKACTRFARQNWGSGQDYDNIVMVRHYFNTIFMVIYSDRQIQMWPRGHSLLTV